MMKRIHTTAKAVLLLMVAVMAGFVSSASAEVATLDSGLARWIQKPARVNIGIALTLTGGTNAVTIEFAGTTNVFYGAGCDISTNLPTFYAMVAPDEPVTLYIWGSKIGNVSGTIIRPKLEDNVLSTIHSPHLPSSPIVFIDKEERYTLSKTNPVGCNYLEHSWELVVKKQPPKSVKIVGKRTADEAGESSVPGVGMGLEIGPSRSPVEEDIALRWSASVGRLSNGRSAGMLMFNANTTNKALSLSAIKYDMPLCRSNDMEILYDAATGDIMQMRAPQTFINLTNISTNGITNGVSISYFRPDQCGSTNLDGYYEIATNATPFVQWQLQSIGTNHFKLRMTEIRSSVSYTSVVEYLTNSACWTLEKGEGAEKVTEQRFVYVSTNGLLRRETNVIMNASSAVQKKTVETYRKYPWGWELTLVVQDPDGENLETSYAFYDDSNDIDNYGNLKWIIQPSGSWEKRVYAGGVLKYSIKPYKNDPPTPDLASINRGLVTWHMYWAGDSKGRLTFWEFNQAVNPTINWLPGTDGIHNQWGQREWSEDETVETYTETVGYIEWFRKMDKKFTEKAQPWQAGLPYAAYQQHGPKKSFGYSYGEFFSTNSTFSTTNQSTWFRQIQVNGFDWPHDVWSLEVYTNSQPISSVEGIAIDPILLTKNISTREDSLYFEGTERTRLKYVYNSSNQWELIERTDVGVDLVGHVTSIVKIDVATGASNTIYEASYTDAGKAWEANENGEVTVYTYDSLKRVLTKTKTGVPAAGTFAAQPDQDYEFYYDALGRVTNEVRTFGSIAYTNVTVFNAIGKPVSVSGIHGVTNIVHDIPGRSVTVYLPGGKYTKEEYYLDGRMAAKTGVGIVPEYYDYRVDNYTGEFGAAMGTTTGHDALKTFYGRTNSQRWSLKHIWGDGLRVSETFSSIAAPAVREKYNIYSPAGNQIGISDNSEFRHFERWEPDNTTFSYVGFYERARSEQTIYEKIGGHWFNTTYMRMHPTEAGASIYVTEAAKTRVSGFESGKVSEKISIDALGREITASVKIDRVNRLRYELMQYSGVENVATNCLRNGLKQYDVSVTVRTPRIWSYDDLNRVTRIEAPTGHSMEMTYDGLTERLLTQTDWATNTTTFAYYGSSSLHCGLMKSETKANGAVTYRDYSELGKPTRIWGTATYPEERSYNEFGELTGLKTYRAGKGWGNANWPDYVGSPDLTTWVIDEASGLATSKIHADGDGYHVQYRWDGKPTAKTLARGVTINYEYNERSDLSMITYSDGTPTIEFKEYDSIGRPVIICDGGGTNYLAYDIANNLTNQTISGIAVDSVQSANYGRSALFLKQGNTVLFEKNYAYNQTNGRISEIAFEGHSVIYSYATNSDLIADTVFKLNNEEVFRTARTYEYGYRLKTVNNTGALVGNVSSHTYQYDEVERRTRTAMTDSTWWEYEYDSRNQLTGGQRRWNTNCLVAGQQFKFAYDNMGNRVKALVGGDGNGDDLRPTYYKANALNQYVSIKSSGVIGVLGDAATNATVTVNNEPVVRQGGYYWKEVMNSNEVAGAWVGVTNVAVVNASGEAGADVVAEKSGFRFVRPTSEGLQYDRDGNLIEDSRWIYRWDGENRLVGLESTASAVLWGMPKQRFSYKYDYAGRRVRKTVESWTNEEYVVTYDTMFIYDGNNVIAEFDCLDTNYELKQSYYWGADIKGGERTAGGVGGLLGIAEYGQEDSVLHLVGFDGNGNVTVLIDSDTQSVSGYYEYSPFGECLRVSGDFGRKNPIRFSTKYLDTETDLIYYGARFYDPERGRWINRDPAKEGGGINLYAFCNNAAIQRFDFDGRSWEDFFQVVTSTLVGAASGALVGWVSSGFNPLGAAVGAIAGAINGLIAGIVGVANDQDWSTILTNAGVTGALSGLAGGFGQFGIGLGILGGSLAGGLNAAYNGASWEGILVSAVIGAAFGAASGYVNAADDLMLDVVLAAAAESGGGTAIGLYSIYEGILDAAR